MACRRLKVSVQSCTRIWGQCEVRARSLLQRCAVTDKPTHTAVTTLLQDALHSYSHYWSQTSFAPMLRRLLHLRARDETLQSFRTCFMFIVRAFSYCASGQVCSLLLLHLLHQRERDQPPLGLPAHLPGPPHPGCSVAQRCSHSVEAGTSHEHRRVGAPCPQGKCRQPQSARGGAAPRCRAGTWAGRSLRGRRAAP
jgi:hypothetical protein